MFHLAYIDLQVSPPLVILITHCDYTIYIVCCGPHLLLADTLALFESGKVGGGIFNFLQIGLSPLNLKIFHLVYASIYRSHLLLRVSKIVADHDKLLTH